jgi:hypothetical protein
MLVEAPCCDSIVDGDVDFGLMGLCFIQFISINIKKHGSSGFQIFNA